MKSTNLGYGRRSLHTQLATLYTHGRPSHVGNDSIGKASVSCIKRVYVSCEQDK